MTIDVEERPRFHLWLRRNSIGLLRLTRIAGANASLHPRIAGRGIAVSSGRGRRDGDSALNSGIRELGETSGRWKTTGRVLGGKGEIDGYRGIRRISFLWFRRSWIEKVPSHLSLVTAAGNRRRKSGPTVDPVKPSTKKKNGGRKEIVIIEPVAHSPSPGVAMGLASRVAHDLRAPVAVVEVVPEPHHAAGAQVVRTDALRPFTAGGVGHGLDAFGASRAAQDLDTRRRGISHVGDDAAEGGGRRGRGRRGGGGGRLGRGALRVNQGSWRWLRSGGFGGKWTSHVERRPVRGSTRIGGGCG